MLTAEQARQMADKAQQTYEELFEDYFDETLTPIIEQQIHLATAQGDYTASFSVPQMETIPRGIFRKLLEETLESLGYAVWSPDNLGFLSKDPNSYNYTIIWSTPKEET